MVDTQRLEEIIASKGVKKTYLASQMGISVQSLRLKLNNRYDMTLSEVNKMCKELGITSLREKEKIFFDK